MSMMMMMIMADRIAKFAPGLLYWIGNDCSNIIVTNLGTRLIVAKVGIVYLMTLICQFITMTTMLCFC